jgi:uncharacterized protein YpbB
MSRNVAIRERDCGLQERNWFQTIKNHVVENMIASEAFKPDLYYDIQTRQDIVDVVRKDGKLKVSQHNTIATEWASE